MRCSLLSSGLLEFSRGKPGPHGSCHDYDDQYASGYSDIRESDDDRESDGDRYDHLLVNARCRPINLCFRYVHALPYEVSESESDDGAHRHGGALDVCAYSDAGVVLGQHWFQVPSEAGIHQRGQNQLGLSTVALCPRQF